MSPLIDVTNIVTKVDTNHSESFSESNRCHHSNNNKNETDKSTHLNYSKIQEIKNIKGNSKHKTPFDVNKSSNVSINCKCNGAKPKIINKTERRKSKKTHLEKEEGKASFSTEIKNDRVPPIEYDDHFFHSLERLSLNSVKEKKTITVPVQENKYKSENKLCCDGCPSKRETTLENFSSTYQCIACGLEFSSLEMLTNHLVKHIYEGLHAASWLNHAMSILLAENETPANSLPTQNLQTLNTMTAMTEQLSLLDTEEKSTEHSTAMQKVET